MGLWDWQYILCHRCLPHHVLHGRDVSLSCVRLCYIVCGTYSRCQFRMYDRTVRPIPERPTTGLRYRVETLIGLTGVKMAKHRTSWFESVLSPFNVVWRPHLLMILIFEVIAFIAPREPPSLTDLLFDRQWCSDFRLVLTYGVFVVHLDVQIIITLPHQVTNAVFLGTPPPVGYGWGPFAIAGGYGTPIVGI